MPCGTKPYELPGRGVVPLELTFRAPLNLKQVKKAIVHPRGHELLDEACELVKMLAWGPEAERSRPFNYVRRRRYLRTAAEQLLSNPTLMRCPIRQRSGGRGVERSAPGRTGNRSLGRT